MKHAWKFPQFPLMNIDINICVYYSTVQNKGKEKSKKCYIFHGKCASKRSLEMIFYIHNKRNKGG